MILRSVKIFFVFLNLMIVFGGCAASSKSSGGVLSNSVPSWYLNPLQSDKQFYYAAGEGSDKEQAKTAALNQIAGEIATNVSSSMEITKKNSNDTYTSQSELNIKTSVETIKFTGVTVLENAFADGKFYSSVRVDKRILFDAQKKIFDIEFNAILATWEQMQKNGSFDILQNGLKLQTSIDKLLQAPTLPILQSINPEFQSSRYVATLQEIDAKVKKMKSETEVVVVSKNSQAIPYKKTVEKYLSSFGVLLVENQKEIRNKSNSLNIEISILHKEKLVKTTDPRLSGATFIDVEISLITKNNNATIVAQNKVNVINVSKEGYDATLSKTGKFEREIEDKGIMGILIEKSE